MRRNDLGYLVGYTGWGSLENLFHAISATTAKQAVDAFMAEMERDPSGVCAPQGNHEDDLVIFVYKFGAEQPFRPKAIEYVRM